MHWCPGSCLSASCAAAPAPPQHAPGSWPCRCCLPMYEQASLAIHHVCCTSLRRRVGGYDSRLPIMEDADLCLRLHMAGGWLPRYVWTVPAECSACAVASCFTSAAWLSCDSVPALHYPGPASQSQRRGHIVQINSPPNHTSGRRLASWGQLHATGVAWVRLGEWRAHAMRFACLSIHCCSYLLCIYALAGSSRLLSRVPSPSLPRSCACHYWGQLVPGRQPTAAGGAVPSAVH